MGMHWRGTRRQQDRRERWEERKPAEVDENREFAFWVGGISGLR